MAQKGKRFVVYKEKLSLSGEAVILMDCRTGAHYLFYHDGYAGGLTPLLGSDGKPYVQKLDEGEPGRWSAN